MSMREMLVRFVTAGFMFVLLTCTAKVASTEPCSGLPCYKYGTCHDANNGKCECIFALHMGPNCSDIDECKQGHLDPCGHRGVCNNTEVGFKCFCNSGWAGVRCENQTGNNVSCMDGYYGDKCEKTESCEHGYKENITNSTERCVCDPGWNHTTEQARCNIDNDECNSNPCLHGGVCINTNGSYNCSCVQPWGDHNCYKNKTEDTTTPLSTSILTSTFFSDTTAIHRNQSISETTETDSTSISETTTERSTSVSETTTTERSTSISETTTTDSKSISRTTETDSTSISRTTATDSSSISRTAAIVKKTSMVSNVLFTTNRIGEINPQSSEGPGAGLAAGMSVGGVAIIAVAVVFLALKFKYKYTTSDILFCKLKRHKIAEIQMTKSDSPGTLRKLDDTTVNEQAQNNTEK